MMKPPELSELYRGLHDQVAEIASALAGLADELEDQDAPASLAEHRELVRQLGALQDHVARAKSGIPDPRALRAELATLLSFARTLRDDAERLSAGLCRAREELERQQAAKRLERERRADQREAALRRRDALQAKIVRAAEGIAGGDGGECRRTIPVIPLEQDVTVCSIAVATPQRRFRSRRFWLVTLTDTGDEVLVRPT